jgi:hypothetical protein
LPAGTVPLNPNWHDPSLAVTPPVNAVINSVEPASSEMTTSAPWAMSS